MAKITENDRIKYHEKIKSYLAGTSVLLKTEKDLLLHIKTDAENPQMMKLTLVDEMLNLSSNYLAINGISQIVMKNKNDDALNECRKSVYKAVIYLEEIVTNFIDAAFSEYEDRLSPIEQFDPNQRYHLIRKMGLAIDLLEQAYGDNSKWRWTFVEIEGRYAAVAKNIVDLRNALVNTDPQSPFYESTVYHLRLIKKLLGQAANRYRDKYELSTGQTLDFKMGVSFLAALRRIHILMAESEEAEELKKKLTIWTTKLTADIKKQEEAKKRA
jgi:hypothetical protein